ncbi:MAG: sulfide/dihydroorotate dehydrogenase-like FAD/NAD-binding protein [Chloroflexi bacterium]|nr:sulfide/dihydroorotate dehydrogenase-like FAD/NAD-binding protein [Chloroflexota bacterium]MBM3175871.1 sulfide/dihydroorotate dehydrogenase-like FAD/NAD-binding protein [Chloroflexota bacterium]MBM4450485.1 sulfide/dihydroorotate dehydrogenase-like FAD/NAD-binding protein [Chloroflexota bacterium]
MYKIVAKEKLTSVIHYVKMEAPDISKKARAGQFVIIRVDDVGERIPLTLADWDAKEGTITLVAMEVGTSTKKLSFLKAGDSISDLVGPLGLPAEIEKFGTVVCVGGGVGIAPVYPIARALKQEGNKIISIIGARCKDLLFWEDRMKAVSDELIVTTDDGSYARKGLVTEPLKEVIEREKVDRVIAIGPAIMMKFCSLTTKPYGVPTIVSLNTIMVDGTGMCGCCRLSVDGATKFACVDGPDFDGHKVDWDIVFARQKVYLEEEKLSLEKWEACHCVKS